MTNGSDPILEKKYNKLNTIIGFVIFFIAAFVYWSTVEPTASYWDCSENLSIYYKLEVGHPPGEPFLQLFQHVISLLSFGNVHKVAPIINRVCATFSACTIMFLFWSISYFARKIIAKTGEFTEGAMYAVLGSAFVGAACFIFADSFWFSAVEASVWSASCCFTTFMFWCATKLDRSEHPERWLIFLSYGAGLGIGVHMLTILFIPAAVFIYCFKMFPDGVRTKWVSSLLAFITKDPKKQGVVIATFMAVVMLGLVKNFVIPQFINIVTWFELFFVNTVGLPFNSGALICGLTVFGLITWGLIYSKKNDKPGLNTALLCAAMVIIGYSSFILLVVRANANPPLNEDNPGNSLTLKDYLDRKQYGDIPTFFAQYYTSPPPTTEEDGGPVYVKDEKKGKYVVSYELPKYTYPPEFTGFFVREWDGSENHPRGYRSWGGLDFDKIPYTEQGYDGQEKTKMIDRPKFFTNNLRYFFTYQLGHMYFRYLLWDFVGRQNDIQCEDPQDNLHGNWITGIPAIDGLRVPQDNLPPELANNKGRNGLYGLPFLLGILGFAFQYRKDKQGFIVNLVLFFFTGIAIILFLNQKPYEPRERDYSYVDSFFAFSIWIGLGILALYDMLSKRFAGKDSSGQPSTKSAAILTCGCCLIVPAIMAHAEWNDHDRSKNYIVRDVAIDYLESCPKNAILFTNGDNDTFPLWYAQEVEGIRTDVRVCNLELLGMSWYVDQMNHKAYESDRMPFSLTHDQYQDGTRDYIQYYDNPELALDHAKYYNLKDIMNFIKSDNKKDMVEYGEGKYINYLPTKRFKLAVDKEAAIEAGLVPKNMADSVVPEIDWTLPGSGISRSTLMVLDAIAHSDWKRPLCFAVTSGPEAYMGLEKYFQLDGMVFVLTPILNNTPHPLQDLRIDVDGMYDKIIHKFKWGNMCSDIYLDENGRRFPQVIRQQIVALAGALTAENKRDSAIKVLNVCTDSISEAACPYDYEETGIAAAYYEAGAYAQANKLAKKMFDLGEKELLYMNTVDKETAYYYEQAETDQYERMLYQLAYFAEVFKQEDLLKEFQARLEGLNKQGILKLQKQSQ